MLKRIVPKKKLKCPNSQFNVAKCVPGNMEAKATGSTVRYSINGAKWKQRLCHPKKGLLPHSYQFGGLHGSPSFLTLKHINFTGKYFHLLRKKMLVFYILILKANFIQNVSY